MTSLWSEGRPARLALMTLLLLAPLASIGLAQAEGGWERVEARYRASRSFAIELPQETWTPLGRELTVGDERRAVKPAGTEVQIDLDGDGELDARIGGEEGFVLLRGRDGARRALRLRSGSGWSCAPGGFLQAEIAGVRVRIIDQDNDGRYGSLGRDAMVLGRGRIAWPLSGTVSLDGAVHELRVDPQGRWIEHRPFAGATGRLDLRKGFATKGLLRSILVQSEDGRHSFDGAEQALVVPAGRYRLLHGEVALGESRAHFTAGASKPFDVPADGDAVPGFGAPLRATFRYQRTGPQLVISPADVRYHGRGGEVYGTWQPIGKSPRFVVRALKTGREIAQALFPGSC